MGYTKTFCLRWVPHLAGSCSGKCLMQQQKLRIQRRPLGGSGQWSAKRWSQFLQLKHCPDSWYLQMKDARRSCSDPGAYQLPDQWGSLAAACSPCAHSHCYCLSTCPSPSVRLLSLLEPSPEELKHRQTSP